MMTIPNLCKNSTLLMVVLYTQLLAVFLFLVMERGWQLEYLGYYSVYLQWCVLGSVGLLCSFRQWLNKWSLLQRNAVSCLICLVVFLLVEFVFQWLNGYLLGSATTHQLERLSLAALIVIFVAHRFIYIIGLLEQRDKAEVQARIEALQSRIRPHFLFNSLNTISELTVTEPQQAEQAINALSLLFRASLENVQTQHSLESELNLCRRYLELERWRLADKLDVQWRVDVSDTAVWQVPKLILQPLIENAVIHGVQESGRVEITIDIKQTNKHLSFMIENRKGAQTNDYRGHGMAIENIKERLFVLYDDQQSFKVRDQAGSYQVIMRFLKQKMSSYSA